MKMKKEKSRGSAKRLIIILSLSLALLIALGAFSFAWIRNYVTVDSLGVKTGQLLYDIKIYDGNGNKLSDVFSSPTDDSTQTSEIVKSIDAADIAIVDDIELFFVIKKHPDSIDFDVALSFDWDKGEGSEYDYVGQLKYGMYDASAELPADVTFDKTDAETGYIAAAPDGEYPQTDDDSLTGIFEKTQSTSLSGDGDDCACIRLKITVPKGEHDLNLLEKNFRLKTRFCVAQTGALDDVGSVETIRVTDYSSLKEAMSSYGYGDTIYIEATDKSKPIEYDGDLVFTRPCTVVLVRTTLEIQGNLIFSYIYDDYFELNTSADGHIKVLKNEGDDAGHFHIDLPNSTMKLVGANNVAAGKADVYVAGDFTANASTKEGEGLTFERLKVCVADSEDLKPLTVDGSSRILVANSTNLGALSADKNCKKLELINKGSIEEIDLRGMSQDTTYLVSPAIFIDNYGIVGGDKTIYLPSFSMKYDENDIESGLDNTRIIANKGSELIKAITQHDSFPAEGAEAAYNISDYFFSTGVNMADGTTRDDIEYDAREIFVEKIDNDPARIIVHYENIPPVLGGDTCETLKDYIEYYSGEKVSADQKIAAVKDITEMKVICYSGKVLDSTVDTKNGDTYSDYSFIKTMTALTTLDLSESGSEGMRVPDNAFKGMTALTDVKMPERDIIWGKNIFTNTGVDEITFPQALTRLDNPINSSNRVTSQAVLDGIKYVRTSITVVDGMWLNTTAKQYFFTFDEFTREQYRELYKLTYPNEKLYGTSYSDWNAKIFVDNKAKRDGEFFYRDVTVDSKYPICEFVAYTGEGAAWASDFDFNEFKGFTIISYDPYAFYDKFKYEEETTIVIDEAVKSIGEYAFACSINTKDVSLGIKSVTINGNPEINGYAFQNNDRLSSVSAPRLTCLKGGYNFAYNDALLTVDLPMLSVVEGNRDLHMCPNLKRVDISVIEKTSANLDFYSADNVEDYNEYMNIYDEYSYAIFYIHTENAMPKSAYTSALAADYRMIFVNEEYAPLYSLTSTYTGVTDMGDKALSDLISANADGTDLKAGDELAYYYVINGSKAELVACMLPEINIPGEDFTTISSFNHNGVPYPVTQIGSAAYHFTKIVAQNITVHDNITTLGNYAFNAQKSKFGKYCITLDLNDVVNTGKGVFYYVSMVRVAGDNLTSIGVNTFAYNEELVVAYLPNLSTRVVEEGVSPVPKVFEGCKKIRIMYVGFSDNIEYDDTFSRMKNYIRFINYLGDSGNIALANVTTVVNSGVPTAPASFKNNLVNVKENFDSIYFSDYYDYKISFMGLTGTIELPGYIYYAKTDGELELISVSPDVDSFCDYIYNAKGGKDYITPGALYEDSGRYTAMNNGTEAKYIITSIGHYAYGATVYGGIDNFIISDNVEILGNGALSGSAYVNSVTSVKPLTNVNCLNLSNVTVAGTYACYNANIEQLNALNLVIVGDSAFSYCVNLKKIYLPSIETAQGTNTFRYCTSLEEITLGESIMNLSGNMFEGCSSLTKLTILNKNNVVTLGGYYLVSSDQASKVYVHVPASIYDAYKKKFETSGFGLIPFANFKKFGNATTEDSLTYYWEILGLLDDTKVLDSSSIDTENLTGVGTAKGTAYLDYVEGTFPTSGELELPSSLEGTVVVEEEFNGTVYQITYTVTCNVVSVKPSLMSALSGVTGVTLPSGMEYLSFTTADLADSIKSLSISGDNDKFKTQGGVLYTKDEDDKIKTLLVCPKALTTADGKLTVADTVTEIFDKAFYGSKSITELEIAGAVTVRNEAFAGAGISTIKFTDTSDASVFAGKDIFLGANVNLQISVPSALLNTYKANVLIDYSIKFITH